MSEADSVLHTFHRKRAMQPQMLGNDGIPMVHESRSGATSPDTSSPRRPDHTSSPKQSLSEPLSFTHSARSRSLRYFEQSTMIPEKRHIQRGIMQSFPEDSDTSPHCSIDNPLRGTLSRATSPSKSPPRSSFERPRSAMPRHKVASPPKQRSTVQTSHSRPRSSEIDAVESSLNLEPQASTTIGPWGEEVEDVGTPHSGAVWKAQSLSGSVKSGPGNLKGQTKKAVSNQGPNPRFAKQRPVSTSARRSR